MRIPGFTAEASLYKTSEPFEFSMAWVGGIAGQYVIPQALPPPADSQITPYPPRPLECTYGKRIPKIVCVEPWGCKKVGCYVNRCCYYNGIPLGCNWVEC
jgi:hypothetical protein